MVNPSNEEKRSLEDTDKHSSFDVASEHESSAPLSKKQRNNDSESNTSLSSKGFYDLKPEKEPNTKICEQDPTVLSDTDNGSYISDSEKEHNMKTCEQDSCFFSDLDSDDEEDDCYETDWDLMKLRPRDWRAVDKWNLPEVYQVFVRGQCPREKSKCYELLDEIGCGDRFLALSVEIPSVFFANLDRDEAASMQALEEVHHVIQYRNCCFTVM